MTQRIDPAVRNHLQKLIRSIQDFPKPGILFWDITPLLADKEALAQTITSMAAPFQDQQIDLVVGIESRGFILGTAIARELDCGFVPVRKPHKLPHETISQEYALEYGTDRLEMHADAIKTGQRILMVDDLLATGGTMQASCQMVEKLGGRIMGISFLIELAHLKGKEKLTDYDVHCILTF
jgi:adenine phosphoribosyltransferase